MSLSIRGFDAGAMVVGADNPEAVGRKHDVERGNCTEQSFGNNKAAAQYPDIVAVGIAADGVERRSRSKGVDYPVFGEVEK